ncbi:B12-binding domain-containing radical SAM protein [Chrysiogenes arsenatis]|uniref:B12-binding domain-containing radical SAM protein n=1 Tax=Chrysiogenes arsenatis TaxID=309797 RepID=UPI00041ECBF4|nr:radical SAM protein [Chrysiogenes arsenatis]
MKILLINPPNCGRSIPEERYGITSLKQIFRGEPLALEVLAGNLDDHDVRILDLKAEPESFDTTLIDFQPQVVGFTAVTCEANTVLTLAQHVRQYGVSTVVVGGIHASINPEFFNHQAIDYVAIGLGKASFRELIDALERVEAPQTIPGVARTTPGSPLQWTSRQYTTHDLVPEKAPRYDLTAHYRSHYFLPKLGVSLGFVASAYGCPFQCSFCCIAGQAGGKYLTQSIANVVRDIALLPADIPVIRLVDANTFGNVAHARQLCHALRENGIQKGFLADVRADTVVNYPDLMREWKEVGLRSVVIGFEEIDDNALSGWDKASNAAINTQAIDMLHEIGITIVGDFILSPEYSDAHFDRLEQYLAQHPVDLPIFTVLTPLPGTPLHAQMRHQITEPNLDYYTLTNAVVPTRLPEHHFYQRYAQLLSTGHQHAKI